MKSAFKKIAALNKAALLRNILFSFLFIVFFVCVLYFLINSPA